MTSQVYLNGSDEPIWVDQAPDQLVARVERAAVAGEPMLTVTSIVTHDPGGDPYFETRTAYIRVDQIAYIAPLGPRARELLQEARRA